MGDLSASAVEIAFPDVVGRESELSRHPVDDLFDHQHPLGTSEAAKGRVGGFVGLTDAPADAHVWDEVGVVAVKHGPLQHGVRQVAAPAAV